MNVNDLFVLLDAYVAALPPTMQRDLLRWLDEARKRRAREERAARKRMRG